MRSIWLIMVMLGKYRNEQRFWGRCERKFKLQRIIEYYSQLFDRK